MSLFNPRALPGERVGSGTRLRREWVAVVARMSPQTVAQGDTLNEKDSNRGEVRRVKVAHPSVTFLWWLPHTVTVLTIRTHLQQSHLPHILDH